MVCATAELFLPLGEHFERVSILSHGRMVINKVFNVFHFHFKKDPFGELPDLVLSMQVLPEVNFIHQLTNGVQPYCFANFSDLTNFFF